MSVRDFAAGEPGAVLWRRESARLFLAQWKQSGLLSSPLIYAPGETIFDHSSGPADDFLLEKGVVAFEREPLCRDQSGMFALCLPGHLFGRDSGFAGSFLYSAVALTHCTVYRISREGMRAALQKGGESALFIIRQYLQNLISVRARATESTVRCTKSRFRHLLLELASALEEHSPGGSIRLPLKDKELASILGISPQQFSVIKREMEGEKVIACSGERNRLALRSGASKVRFFKVYRYKRISGIASSA